MASGSSHIRLTFSPPVRLDELYMLMVNWKVDTTLSFFSPGVVVDDGLGATIVSGLPHATVRKTPVATSIEVEGTSGSDGAVRNGKVAERLLFDGVVEFTGNSTITDLFLRTERREGDANSMNDDSEWNLYQGITFARIVSTAD